jgi:hypothetical protein
MTDKEQPEGDAAAGGKDISAEIKDLEARIAQVLNFRDAPPELEKKLAELKGINPPPAAVARREPGAIPDTFSSKYENSPGHRTRPPMPITPLPEEMSKRLEEDQKEAPDAPPDAAAGGKDISAEIMELEGRISDMNRTIQSSHVNIGGAFVVELDALEKKLAELKGGAPPPAPPPPPPPPPPWASLRLPVAEKPIKPVEETSKWDPRDRLPKEYFAESKRRSFDIERSPFLLRPQYSPELREAAEAGSTLQQKMLGETYECGYGIHPNTVAAYAWYDVACSLEPVSMQGLAQLARKFLREKRDWPPSFWHDAQPYDAQPALYRRDRLAWEMTPEQIAKAQEMSKELLKKIEANKAAKEE